MTAGVEFSPLVAQTNLQRGSLAMIYENVYREER